MIYLKSPWNSIEGQGVGKKVFALREPREERGLTPHLLCEPSVDDASSKARESTSSNTGVLFRKTDML